MKAFGLAIVAIICCVLGAASILPSQAQTDQWFSFQACNASPVRNVSLAILSKGDANASTWHLEGWYNLPDGGCSDLGGYWRDRVYVFAMGDDGAFWGGEDTSQCVNLTARFERTVRAAYDCSNGETSVGMSAFIVPADAGVATLNLQ
jgi:uncharacterized membrane protein